MGLFVLAAALVAEGQVVAGFGSAEVFYLLIVLLAIHCELSIVYNRIRLS